MAPPNTDSGPWTIARLLSWTREHLARAGVESPRLCAEILLAHAMHCERLQLYTQYDRVPDEEVLAPFREAVRQAARGQPVAYLTGRKEFFSLSFEVTPEVLIPRPETEILVERTIDLVRRSSGTVRSILDLGTGSGCIAVSLALHLPEVSICASDISEAALAVARRNAERHKVGARIEFALGDLFEPWTGRPGRPDAATRFDAIVSNPPYVSTDPEAPVEQSVRRFEPQVALMAGPEGLDVIRRLVIESPRHLTAGGHLLMEIGFDQAERVRALLEAGGWQDILGYRDGAGYLRVFHARRPVDSAGQTG